MPETRRGPAAHQIGKPEEVGGPKGKTGDKQIDVRETCNPVDDPLGEGVTKNSIFRTALSASVRKGIRAHDRFSDSPLWTVFGPNRR